MDATLDTTDPETLVAALVANAAELATGAIPYREFEVRNAVIWRRVESAGAVVTTRVRDLLRARVSQ